MKLKLKIITLISSICLLLSSGTYCLGDSSINPTKSQIAKNLVKAGETIITASSSAEGSGWSKSGVADGFSSSAPEKMGWSSNISHKPDNEQWVLIDLKKTYLMDRIAIYPRNDKGYEGEGFPVDFNIQVSKDNIDWVTIGTRNEFLSSGNVESFRIAVQSVRYIKVTGTKLRKNKDNNKEYKMQLAEIEAYYDDYKHTGSIRAKRGAAYYVSSSEGNDSNDGLSPSKPWKTLTRASEMIYSSGNRILLKCGDEWRDETFFPHGNGTQRNPITITAYGEGERPIIKAGYGAAHGIKIVNASSYKITGLEFSHSASGIMAVADQAVNINSLWIEDCYFHDIESPSIRPDIIMPYPEIYFGSGIVIACFGNEKLSGKTYYKNITITRCNFDKCDTGIINTLVDMPMALDGTACVAHLQFSRESLRNVYISDVRITKSYRSGGIMLYGVRDGVIDNAFIDETGYKKGMYWGVAACQLSMCEDFIVKNSEFTRTYRTNNSPDGEGFDFESGNKNVVLYNCYIHNNEGPAILFYGENKGWRSNNYDCIVDSCIIENNGIEGTFDHSKAFKNYKNNTGIIKNCKIGLNFDAQYVSYQPLEFSATNYIYDAQGQQIWGPGISMVNSDDPAISYEGQWDVLTNENYFNGKANASKTKGSALEMKFWGKNLKIIGAKGRQGGKAEIYIDGVLEKTVDLSADNTLYKQVLFEKNGLSDKVHTLKVVCVQGEVIIDAFDYYEGDVPPAISQKENLALSAKVSASTSLEGWGWGLKNINDGYRSSLVEKKTGWSSNGKVAENHEEWVMFDFGSSKVFDQVDIYVADLFSPSGVSALGLHFPVDIKISVSEDNKQWKDIYVKSGMDKPNSSKQQINFGKDISARYVKITGTKLRSNPDEKNYFRMQFAEVEIFRN